MLKTLRKFSVMVALAASLVLPMAAPAAMVAAADGDAQTQINNNLGCGVNLNIDDTQGNCDTNGGTGQIQNIITKGINFFSIIVGIVAVVMIIVGGFKYITSGGDSGNVSSAKSTIMYAIIGLVIVALAQFFVQFVLNKVTQ